VAWGSKLPCTKNEEIWLVAGESCPYNSTAQRPNDEESLEAEMEQHARSSHIGLTQVCIKVKCANWRLAAIHDLRARAPSFGLPHSPCIHGLPDTHVREPCDDSKKDYRKSQKAANDQGPILEVALSIVVM
jgi:hypothetical protein